MWSIRSSFVSYVYFIVVLTITSHGVKAQYDIRDGFYSRYFAHNINNLRHVGEEYGNGNGNGNGNGIGSNYPPSAIQFSYSGDKTVGDYCYTKSLAGVCTLTSKCPEVVKDIQRGKYPVVCSYQASEAIVCCPKRNTQSNQPAWSNSNNNYDYYQGSSTNQVYPINQNNVIYPTQPANQIYQTNQVNPFYSSNQAYPTTQPSQVTPPRTTHSQQPPQPPQPPQNSQTYQEVFPNRHSDKRRSEQKCDEYSKLATHSVSILQLSVSPSPQEVNIPTCNYPTGLIVGGEVAKNGEFPHMAAIGWTSGGEVDWKCGGSLISDYFVVTAAHCSSLYGISPDIVRLGDQNLVKQDDGAQPQEYQIASIIVHPDYTHSSNYYDIALIRLTPQVTFTRYIRPACLWQTYYVNSTKTIATGWGQVEFAGDRSDDLRKVSLNVIDNSQCEQLYQPMKGLRNGIVSSQLCAGFLEGGKDTCQGDSGGPIQVITPKNQCIFHIIGITSFGKACAAVNAAGVYTRVSSYLDWIERNVWP